MAKEVGRSRSTIYRVIVEERLARLNRRKVKFIDDVLYHQADAVLALEAIYSQKELSAAPVAAAECAHSAGSAGLSARPLSHPPADSQARARLFLKLNFHKFQFVTARRKVDPQYARGRDLRLLEAHRRDIVATKNELSKPTFGWWSAWRENTCGTGFR